VFVFPLAQAFTPGLLEVALVLEPNLWGFRRYLRERDGYGNCGKPPERRLVD